MFDLNTAIEQWCNSTLRRHWGSTDRVSELVDHLHCEVEHLQRQYKLSAEQAFLTATRQLGEQNQLGSEYAKNRTLLDTLCALESGSIKADNPVQMKTRRLIVLVHSLLFAGALIIAALIMRGFAEKTAFMLQLILIFLWYTTYTMLPGINGSVRQEWQCLRKWLMPGKR